MAKFFGLACTRRFGLLHALLGVYPEDQPQRYIIAVRQLHNQVGDLAWVTFLTPLDALQQLQYGADRRLIVWQQMGRILSGAPRPVGANTTRLQCADLDPKRRDLHGQSVAETAHGPLG